jgi:hypothetical protein
MDQDVLPPHYQGILAVVQGAGGPVSTKKVGQELGLDTVTPGKLEPLRGKLSKLAGRGWLRKLPDGRFTARPCPAATATTAAHCRGGRNPRSPGGC